MSAEACGQLRAEADLIDRFARSYRRKFSQMIEQLNHQPAQLSDMQCLRVCVEAVDMMLASQSELAKAMCRMSQPPAQPDVEISFRSARTVA